MLASYRWLKEICPTKMAPDQMAHGLTMQGNAVESITDVGAKCRNIIVGQIMNSRPHPNADNLTLLEVTIGEAPMEIVCGAKNMKTGDKVAVALPGTVLPGGFQLEKRKIRGIESNGMCCSLRELEMGEDHSGILILPENTTIGISLAEALSLDDHIFELDITANRPDALSHRGLAREIAAMQGHPLSPPSIEVIESGEEAGSRVRISIEASDLCQRYAARIITGVSIGPAPEWMRQRLESCGVRSINNVVDVTNFVLLEYGHPLHAFDLARLKGPEIVVRRPRSGEKMVTLDGVERNLTEKMLVIADAERPVALAGIMGGSNSEVDGNTVDVLLESAYFHPPSIRKTRKALGISTEASYRFERGADYEGLIHALDRAATLIGELAGGTVLKGRIDVKAKPPKTPDPAERRKLTLRVSRVAQILGVAIPREEIVEILGNVGIEVTGSDREQINVWIPSFRKDIEREIDLIEEVARIYGYNRFPSTLGMGRTRPGRLGERNFFEQYLKETFLSCGFSEAINYCFEGTAGLDRLRIPEDSPLRRMIGIENPLSLEESGLRTTLVPAMVRSLSLNARRGNLSAALFEIACSFHPDGDDPVRFEKRELVAGAYGPVSRTWLEEERERDFFDAKGLVEEVLRSLRIDGVRFTKSEKPWLHPGRTAEVFVGDSLVGELGEMLPTVASEFDLRGRVILIRLDLEVLFPLARFVTERFVSPSAYPSVERDFAVVTGSDVQAESVEAILRETPGKMLESLSLFDVYTGPPLEEGQRSLAYRLTLRSREGTLTDEEVEQVSKRIVKRLSRELGVSLRE